LDGDRSDVSTDTLSRDQEKSERQGSQHDDQHRDRDQNKDKRRQQKDEVDVDVDHKEEDEERGEFWEEALNQVRKRCPGVLIIGTVSPSKRLDSISLSDVISIRNHASKLFAFDFDSIVDPSTLLDLFLNQGLDSSPPPSLSSLSSTSNGDQNENFSQLFQSFETSTASRMREEWRKTGREKMNRTGRSAHLFHSITTPLDLSSSQLNEAEFKSTISLLSTSKQLFLDSRQAICVAAILLTLPGLKIVSLSEILGLSGSCLDVRRQRFEFSDPSFVSFFQTLFSQLSSPAFCFGLWEILPVFSGAKG